MDLANYFKRQIPMPGLNGIEKVAAVYVAITLMLTYVFLPDMDRSQVLSIVGGRVVVAALTYLLYKFYRHYPCHASYQLRVIFQVALLGYWYPDIYNLACMMPSQDHLLAHADQVIFGYQPAIEFSQTLSGIFWNELFNLGYFSYYLMIVYIVLLAIVKRPRRFDSVTFIFMATFFMYYVCFLLFNAAGPQFYFNCPGVDPVNAVFPPMDTYFHDHNTLHHMSPVTGPFSYLVHLMQGSERPIAAFPSSHVGVSTVILLLAFRLKKKYGLWVLPFWVILCFSTVYIGAHYAVDVFAGWISAIIFIILASKLYKTPFLHRPKGFDELHRLGHHHMHRRRR